MESSISSTSIVPDKNSTSNRKKKNVESMFKYVLLPKINNDKSSRQNYLFQEHLQFQKPAPFNQILPIHDMRFLPAKNTSFHFFPDVENAVFRTNYRAIKDICCVNVKKLKKVLSIVF